jgi:hypothetical protein
MERPARARARRLRLGVSDGGVGQGLLTLAVLRRPCDRDRLLFPAADSGIVSGPTPVRRNVQKPTCSSSRHASVVLRVPTQRAERPRSTCTGSRRQASRLPQKLVGSADRASSSDSLLPGEPADVAPGYMVCPLR